MKTTKKIHLRIFLFNFSTLWRFGSVNFLAVKLNLYSRILIDFGIIIIIITSSMIKEIFIGALRDSTTSSLAVVPHPQSQSLVKIVVGGPSIRATMPIKNQAWRNRQNEHQPVHFNFLPQFLYDSVVWRITKYTYWKFFKNLQLRARHK